MRYGRAVSIAGLIAVAVYFIERRELGHLLRHFGL